MATVLPVRDQRAGWARDVLLLPDVEEWALGVYAHMIARAVNGYNFRIISTMRGRIEPGALDYALRHASIVHTLSEYSLPPAVTKRERPWVAAVNHALDPERIRPLMAADAIVVTTEQWRAYVREHFGRDDGVFLVPYGVDTALFRPRTRHDAARRALGLGGDDFLVGFAAKRSSDELGRKRLDLFEEVVVALAGAVPRLAVVIAGIGWDRLCAQLRKRGVRVVYLGFQPRTDYASTMRALDSYIVTSSVEGGPLPLLEAMASGVVPVASAAGLALDSIEDGVSGYLVDRDEPDAYVERLARLAHDPDLRAAMGAQARRVATERLDFMKRLAGLGAVYEHACAAWGGAPTPAPRRALRDLSYLPVFDRGAEALYSAQFIGWQGEPKSAARFIRAGARQPRLLPGMLAHPKLAVGQLIPGPYGLASRAWKWLRASLRARASSRPSS